MVLEKVRVSEINKWKPPADDVVGEIFVADSTAQDATPVQLRNIKWERDYLTATDDPVLAALWDNEADAIYDDL